MNAASHYLAISYAWFLVPPEVTDFDVVLILSLCRADIADSGILEVKKPEVLVYHAKLPEKGIRYELSDVSGNLGLLHPVSDKFAERKVAAFERLVADVILWRLAQESFHISEETVIVLQGPTLPKLRGRLMYRGISDRVTFCVLTCQSEWFRRLEAAEQSYKVLLEGNRTGFGAVYPPRTLDRGTRAWVFRSSKGVPLHFEVVTNMFDCSLPARDWLGDTQSRIERLVSPTLLESSEPSLTPLPAPLSKAIRQAEDVKKREDVFIKFLLALRNAKYSPDALQSTSVFQRILEKLKEAAKTTVGRQTVLRDYLGRENEEKLYALFKDAWPEIKTDEVGAAEPEPISLVEPRTKPLFSRKELSHFRHELWECVEGLVVPSHGRLVQKYLKKVAEDALTRGPARVAEIRELFIDRKFTMPPEGREVFNRFNGPVIVKRIAAETGVSP